MKDDKKQVTKEWYKNWWGVLLAICIWPFFLIWYFWTKTNWKNQNKWIATAVVILVVISLSSNGKTTEKTTTKNEVSKTSEAVTETTKTNYSFDVPSLLNKNIDEIRTTIGTPTDKEQIEPNQAQLDLGTTEWDNTFKNGDKELLVTYNVKSRKVIDFFISTDTQDKNKLLETGNLKPNDSTYKIDYVKELKDPTRITGVKVTPN